MGTPEWMLGMDHHCLTAFEKRYPLASKGLSKSGEDIHALKGFSEALRMLQIYWSGWKDAKEAEA